MQRSTNSCVHVGEHAKILDAARADIVDQALDAAEILDPQRHRRMREQAERIVLALRKAAPRAFALGDVLDGDHHAIPALFMAGQHRCRAAGCRGARRSACS